MKCPHCGLEMEIAYDSPKALLVHIQSIVKQQKKQLDEWDARAKNKSWNGKEKKVETLSKWIGQKLEKK